MYAHAIDEIIWKGENEMNMPFPSREQVEFIRKNRKAHKEADYE